MKLSDRTAPRRCRPRELESFASGMPSSLPAICASTVSEPCPISTVPVYMDRLASSLSFTTAQEMDGVIVALIMQASPFPLLTPVACDCFPVSPSPCLP